MLRISVPVLCFALAAALVLFGGLAAALGRSDLLLAGLAPALILTPMGFILRNFDD